MTKTICLAVGLLRLSGGRRWRHRFSHMASHDRGARVCLVVRRRTHMYTSITQSMNLYPAGVLRLSGGGGRRHLPNNLAGDGRGAWLLVLRALGRLACGAALCPLRIFDPRVHAGHGSVFWQCAVSLCLCVYLSYHPSHTTTVIVSRIVARAAALCPLCDARVYAGLGPNLWQCVVSLCVCMCVCVSLIPYNSHHNSYSLADSRLWCCSLPSSDLRRSRLRWPWPLSLATRGERYI